MLEKEITTSKGTFVVNNYRKGVKLQNITEDTAGDIVDDCKCFFTREKGYFDYNYDFNMYRTAIESLHSLIEANNIEKTNKLYIFKN